MKLGETLPKRKEKIKELLATSTKRIEPIEFQGKRQDLNVYTVSVDFPKYRLDNGRTKSVQAAYLASHPELPHDFFTRDLEAEVAQRAQHQILKGMLIDGSKSLLKYFKEHAQTQPFILSHLGYVVNGNRRLCAFRELIEEDSVANKDLQNIEVVFLPPADVKDIDRLEARLQIADDIKADYGWTAQAFMLRERRDVHGFKEKELASIYEKSETEIKELLDMLSLAEVYLADRGKPFQYPEVEKDEFAFRQLHKNRQKFKDDEVAKDVFDRLAYCVIDGPEEGRAYAIIPGVAKHFSRIVGQVQKEIPAPKTTKKETGKTTSSKNRLGTVASPLKPLVPILEDEKNYSTVRDVITEVVASEKAKAREEKKETKVLNSISRAVEFLEEAIDAWDLATSQDGLKEQVTKAEDCVRQLKKKLK